MSEDEQVELMIKGMVASLPPEDGEKVRLAVKEINEVVAKHGAMGLMAIAVIGAELAAKA